MTSDVQLGSARWKVTSEPGTIYQCPLDDDLEGRYLEAQGEPQYLSYGRNWRLGYNDGGSAFATNFVSYLRDDLLRTPSEMMSIMDYRSTAPGSAPDFPEGFRLRRDDEPGPQQQAFLGQLAQRETAKRGLCGWPCGRL